MRVAKRKHKKSEPQVTRFPLSACVDSRLAPLVQRVPQFPPSLGCSPRSSRLIGMRYLLGLTACLCPPHHFPKPMRGKYAPRTR